MKSLIALMVTLGLTLVATPQVAAEPIPPQIGGGHVGVRFADFRFPGTGCYNHTGFLDVFANDDLAYEDFNVSLDLTVTRDGEIVDSWYDWKEFSATYTLTTQFCHSVSRTGNYKIAGTVTFWDWDYNSYPVYVSNTFNVLAPHTASVAASKAPYRAHGWKVKGTVKYDGRPWKGKLVYLQVKRGGGWGKVAKKKTDSRGRVAFNYTPPRGAAKSYRLYTKASNGVSAKSSKAIKLKRR